MQLTQKLWERNANNGINEKNHALFERDTIRSLPFLLSLSIYLSIYPSIYLSISLSLSLLISYMRLHIHASAKIIFFIYYIRSSPLSRRLCSTNQFQQQYLQVVAGTCLMLAAKGNEQEERVPSLSDLVSYCGGKDSPSLFAEVEGRLLALLDWGLQTCIHVDFVEFWGEKGVLFDTDELDNHKNIHTHPHASKNMKKFAVFFMDIICQGNLFVSSHITGKKRFSTREHRLLILAISSFFNRQRAHHILS